MEIIKKDLTKQGSKRNSLQPGRMWQSTFQATLHTGEIEPQYHARRAHKKSRNGCTTCKKRRVKCDELKPICRRCQHYGASCTYLTSSESTPKRFEAPLGIPSTTAFSLSITETISKIKNGLNGDLEFAPRIAGDSQTTLSIATTAFRQFLNDTCVGVGSPGISKVMGTDMIHIAFKTPYLMFTILASGILHINRISPGDKARELAEVYFWQQAIKLYQAALLSGITRENFDGLVSACMLMGVSSLCPTSFTPADSWVITGRPSDMNWLCLQGGLACLLMQGGRHLKHSIWGPPFARSHDTEQKLYMLDIQKGRMGLHEGLADLCEINDTSTQDTNPYYMAVKLLSPLLTIEMNAQNAAQAATWMGRLEHEYLALLRERDPRALVVIAHWMGLMCLVAKWEQWVFGRIIHECTAICSYLELAGDPTIQPFLEYPAHCCGYPLNAKKG